MAPTPVVTELLNCVLLGERHHGLSDAVRGLLETAFSAVFMVADSTSLLEGAARIRPQLVVVDTSLAGGDLPGLLQALRGFAPEAKVVLLSVHEAADVAAAAMASGADSIVQKHSIATDLLPAIDALMKCSGRFTEVAGGGPAASFTRYP
jgi:DNA-binding NarL/FixJ family response regulator